MTSKRPVSLSATTSNSPAPCATGAATPLPGVRSMKASRGFNGVTRSKAIRRAMRHVYSTGARMLHWVRPKYRKLPDILLAHGVLYGAHMPTPKWSLLIPAALAFACGGTPGEDSDTDDLSATTYSMEMVRANPALLPGVTPPAGQRVDGHSRPLSSDDSIERMFPIGRDNWLYDANGLNQFVKLTDPAAYNKTDAKDATYSRQPGDLLADDSKLTWLDVEQGY